MTGIVAGAGYGNTPSGSQSVGSGEAFVDRCFDTMILQEERLGRNLLQTSRMEGEDIKSMTAKEISEHCNFLTELKKIDSLGDPTMTGERLMTYKMNCLLEALRQISKSSKIEKRKEESGKG